MDRFDGHRWNKAEDILAETTTAGEAAAILWEAWRQGTRLPSLPTLMLAKSPVVVKNSSMITTRSKGFMVLTIAEGYDRDGVDRGVNGW